MHAKTKKRPYEIRIIGSGAIGGYYGGKLAKAGQEVHFLFRSDYDYVKANGLQVDSCDGSFHLHPINAYHQTTEMPPCDVVLVCLKSVTDAMTPYSPSMRLDYDFHRQMEIYYLYTRPIEIAREAGFRMSKLEMLEAELKFLQENL